MTVRHGRFRSALGELLIVAEGDALTGLYFENHKYPPAADGIGEDIGAELGGDATTTGAEPATADPVLGAAARQLREYLAGERTRFDIPLAPQGDAFSQRVWEILCEIPSGETTTYGAIAQRVGGRGLAQRVGQAVGHNPVSIIIPCHRVLGADGSLTGYAGGLDRKRALLALEEPPAEDAGRLF
ncbi:methylated-DNA--[protein]-cysteine S-methyltransferase [Leucobacter ruminantium]|uniref:Methylated-DNA--protein-cysteine methyltransferase n=1 Tax=Leucobacter ruminantium TaxID=1289170 RepID=A0A939LUN7_9MICO|nr:methylated-DNA--[protein]-cysteine S-methyltransferase [Leucobacter ruminantium]MBO1805120.1 methylated-DNA--[protein]-cysteine S-methyltransferase [Leucobacter ruminantium]